MRKMKTWNMIERSTGVCVYQIVSDTQPEAQDGYVVREAVTKIRRPGNYSDRSQMRAESGYAQ